MRSLVCFNPPLRRCTPCSTLFFLVHVLSNVIAPASWPLSARRTSHSLPLKVRRLPLCGSGHTLHVARELENWPLNHQFTPAEIDTMATAWAAQSVASGRASTPKHPQRMFRLTAVAFLRFSDRFHLTPTAAPGRY